MERLTRRNPDGTYYYQACFERCGGVMDPAKCMKCEIDAAISAKIGTAEDSAEKKELHPTNFDRVTASPEVLAEFLNGLPIQDGPWDDAFQRTFCDACPAEDCDTAPCPHEAKRNNPAWWLGLEAMPK